MCKAHLSQLSEGHVNLFLIFESILVFTWKEKLRRVWWWRQRPNPKWLDPQDGEIWWWDNSIWRFTSHSLGYDTLSIKFILFDFEVLSGPLCLVFVHMCAIFFAFGNATKVWVTIFLSNCMQLSGTALKYFERSLLSVEWGPARSKGNLKAMTLLLMMVTDVKFPKVTFTSLEKCGSAMIKYGLITQRTTNTSTRARWLLLVLRHSSCIKVWTWYPSHLLTLGRSRQQQMSAWLS